MANKTIYPYGVGGQTPSGIDIVNDLVTGGADKALSAEQGKVLKSMVDNGQVSLVDEHDNNTILSAPTARQVKLMHDNIMTIYDGLANIAFTDGKPELDWVGEKTSYNITMSLVGCSASITTGGAGNGKVYEGVVVIRITTTKNHSLDNVSVVGANNEQVSVNVTDYHNGTVDVLFTAKGNVTLSANAIEDAHATISLSSGSTNVVGTHDGFSVNFPLKVYADMLTNDAYNIVFAPTSGNEFTTLPNVGGVELNNNTLVVTATNVENNASIEVSAVAGVLYNISTQGLGSGVNSSNTATTVASGSSFYTKLSTSNNLYVVNDSTVQVLMGGTNVTSQVYSNDEINIPSVNGDIEISASSITYVSDSLVMHLDGMNRGGVAGKWTSLVNYNNGSGFNAPIEFNLTDCTEYDDHVYFNGTTSKGTLPANYGITTLPILASRGTFECYYDGSELVSNMLCIMYNGYGSLIEFSVFRQASGQTANDAGYVWVTMCTGGNPADGTDIGVAQANVSTQMQPQYLGGGHFSCTTAGIVYNKYLNAGYGKAVQSATTSTNPKLSIMYKDRTTSNACTKGNLYFIRVYSRKLTSAEKAQNIMVDEKRFGVTFTCTTT